MKKILVALTILLGVFVAGQSALAAEGGVHGIAIHVNANDPERMNVALNNATGLVKFFADKGEKAEVRILAIGAGLPMFRSDTSPVAERIKTIQASSPNIRFEACGTTMANVAKREGKDVPLLPGVTTVPLGIGELVLLQEQGWAYIRP